MAAGAGYRFGQFVLNLDRSCLQKGGVDLALRPKAFVVLRYLVERAGRLATKDELVSAVWPDVIVSDDSLTQCIRDIRKVLNDDGEQFIRTVQRRGYMFVAATAPFDGTEGPTAAAVRAKLSESAPAESRPVAALVALVLVAALGAWSRGWLGRQPPVADTRLTIAVLPFAYLGDKPGEDWLGDGIAEDIRTAVSRFRDLVVIGRHSSSRYRGDAVDIRQAAKELGAHYVLQGSVRRSGDRLRITAQLVDPQTGAGRWSERYDRPFSDVFAIQDEVASKVAALLVAHAREAMAARLRTRAPAELEAYELVLRGRKAYLSFKREGVLEGRALFEQAIAIDPSYAPAWSGLSGTLLQLYIQPYSEHQGAPAMLELARAAAQRAVSLDPDFAPAQVILGIALTWAREHDAGLEALRRAMNLNPNDELASFGYAQALYFAGFNREAIEVWERTQRLNPFFPGVWFGGRASPHIMLREFEPALRLARLCAERAPSYYPCVVYLAIAARELGLEDEARSAVKRVIELYPKFTIRRHMQVAPFRRDADALQFGEYLRRAGLPE
jgi:TolB-like protein/DNA-binding winged helix-turn-helix (wHTH) protein/Flp pilus assembly protein TadD